MSQVNKKKSDSKGLCIPISEENRAQIQAVLDEKQGPACADELTVDDLLNYALTAERELSKAGIARSYWAGATYRVSPSGPATKAYRYARTGTSLVILRKRDHWVLIMVERVSVWSRQKGGHVLTMTRAQRQRSLKRFFASADLTREEILMAVGLPCNADTMRQLVLPTAS